MLHATDGPSAVELAESLPHVDLLLTDGVMPGGMSGVALAARMRALSETESRLLLRLSVEGARRPQPLVHGWSAHQQAVLEERVRSNGPRHDCGVTDAQRGARRLNEPRPHLLIVDDEPDFAEYLGAVAESVGYRCTIATDACGFEDAIQQDIDLIMLDLVMPGADGIELLRLLAHARHPAGRDLDERLRQARPGVGRVARPGARPLRARPSGETDPRS